MRYPKINSLFKRHPESGMFLWGDYSQPEFDLIKKWRVEEKIDGMNVRVIFTVEADNSIKIELKGRNEDSMIPSALVNHMETKVMNHAMKILEFMNCKGKMVMFGEGYGPKIQSGGNYRDDIGFILFDVWGGHRWSSRGEVAALAHLLDLPMPFDYGMMTEQEIINLVAGKPLSPTAIRPMQFEGVICRSEPLLRNNYTGDPLVFKFKCKDL